MFAKLVYTFPITFEVWGSGRYIYSYYNHHKTNIHITFGDLHQAFFSRNSFKEDYGLGACLPCPLNSSSPAAARSHDSCQCDVGVLFEQNGTWKPGETLLWCSKNGEIYPLNNGLRCSKNGETIEVSPIVRGDLEIINSLHGI